MKQRDAPLDFTGRTCEETTGMIDDTYFRCGRPAVVLVQHIGRDEGPYFMCAACGDHNIRNRHGSALAVAATVHVDWRRRWGV